MPTSAKSLCRKTFLAMPLFVVALFTAASCGSSGGGGQTTYAHTISRIIPYIEEQMQKDQVTGMALVLVDGGRTVWARGFGYADLAQQIPATEETLFEIGSNSKTMTAALVMAASLDGGKSLSAASLTVPNNMIIVLGLLFTIVLPIVCVVAGLVICVIRRRR